MLETILLIRHAAPDRAMKINYHVVPGPPLTEQGRAEAQQAAGFVAYEQPELLLVSPFARTRETAVPIAAAIERDPLFLDTIGEMAPGERLEQVRARVRDVLAGLEDGPHQRVALITHGAVIHATLLELTRDRIELKERYDFGNITPTASVWRCVRSEGNWACRMVFRPDLQVL